MAPPTPTRPETNAPARLSTTRARRKVTPSRLPQAGIVGGHVAERLVGDRLQDGLHLGERLVAGAALVGLEQQELVLDVRRRLPGDGGPELARVALAALALGAVAGRALRGGDTPALDGAAIGLDRRDVTALGREVRRHLVDAEQLHLLGERLHLGRDALARGVILDRFLEVHRRQARQDRHRVRAAVAGGAVTGRARHGLHVARLIERPRGRRGLASAAGQEGRRRAEHHDPRQQDDAEEQAAHAAPPLPRTSAQMLLAHPSACCAYRAEWPGVSFGSTCTTLPFSILYALITAIASRSLTHE